MNKKLLSILAGTIFVAILTGFIVVGNALFEEKVIKMSTTTSTQASGLLDVLLPALKKDLGIDIKVIAKGTGAAIRDGKDGNVDLIFVHARSREEEFVKQGYGTNRYAVMKNDFVILGPKDDPAGINGSHNAVDSLTKIAADNALFVSRGDDSGTHTKEQALWEKTGLPLKTTETTIIKKGEKTQLGFIFPKGKWYLSLGQGMGGTLTFADEKRAYTLSDRGTYIKYRYGRKRGIDLAVLCENDAALDNPYGVVPVNPKKHPHVKYDLAMQLVRWLQSERGQSEIANYKLLGKQLFYPDAS